ncbi:MAG: DUF4019 domain-containing protein [Acidiferrobacterales bacterium]|nr:DUF4019 domain-containing protein [Acidiferrobacterales bacterium]
MKLLITSLAILISEISFASEEIKFHDEADNTYVVELISSDEIDEKKGLDIIANAALNKCGDESAHLGQYRFQGKQNLGNSDDSGESSFRMVQLLFCGELPDNLQVQTKPLSPQETSNLENQAKAATDLYLSYLAESDFEKAYSLISTELKQNNSFNEWADSKKSLAKPLGNLLQSEVWGTTTYIDPPSAPKKGVYIATDFEREYTSAPIYCGYLVWFLEGEELRVIREDIGSISLDQFNEITDD